MSYGHIPYDKNSYKASKRRRKQAMIAEKTGKILPYNYKKRRRIAIVAVIIILFAVVGALIAVLLTNTENSTEKENTLDNSDLLKVVNTKSPLASDYVPKLTECVGVQVNTLVADSLLQMLADAKANSIELKIKSAYISYQEQKMIFDVTLQSFLDNSDYTQVRAEAAAQKICAKAGCSEAQTGLLVEFDITDEKARAFIERNCINYGFVQRYPSDKTAETHREKDASIYRFVGKDNAVKMRSFNMCLEEYNDYLALQGSE